MEFDRCSLATSYSRVRDLATRAKSVVERKGKCSSSLPTYCEMTSVRVRWAMVFLWNLSQLLNREHYEHAERISSESIPYMGTRTVSIDCADGMKHDSIGISMLSVIGFVPLDIGEVRSNDDDGTTTIDNHTIILASSVLGLTREIG